MVVQVVYLFLPQVFISSLWYFPLILCYWVKKSYEPLGLKVAQVYLGFHLWCEKTGNLTSLPPHWIGYFPITAGPSPSLPPLGICQVSLVPIYSLGYREILIVTQPTILAPGSLNWEPSILATMSLYLSPWRLYMIQITWNLHTIIVFQWTVSRNKYLPNMDIRAVLWMLCKWQWCREMLPLCLLCGNGRNVWLFYPK